MKEDLIRKICELPQNLKTQDKSVFQLLKESSYFEKRQSVEKSEIIEFLDNHPELLDDWELYSEDKRASSGWHFLSEGENWTVGYLNFGKQDKAKIFSSRIEACAVFIINEIEEIAI
jgi:hypothetical protein